MRIKTVLGILLALMVSPGVVYARQDFQAPLEPVQVRRGRLASQETGVFPRSGTAGGMTARKPVSTPFHFAGIPAPIESRQETRVRQRSFAAPQAIPAVPLTPARFPGRGFTVALPPGWTLTSSPGGDALSIHPSGSNQPDIYLTVVGVSDLRYQARLLACSRAHHPFGNSLSRCVMPSVATQLADSRWKWTPEQAFQVILQRLRQARAGRTFGPPALIPLSPSQAFYRVRSTTPAGIPREDWGIVTMIYLPNPMLGPGEVTSLALIAGCLAPSNQADGFRRACAGVLDSFHPDPNWEGRLAAGIAAIYAREAQILLQMGRAIAQGFAVRREMITRVGQSIRRMQLRTFQAIQTRKIRTGQNWIATFGGNTNLRDPETGKYYTVPDGYGSYCLDDRGPTPVVLMGPDEVPGKAIGGAVCQRRLGS